jgi:hypothetical protein
VNLRILVDHHVDLSLQQVDLVGLHCGWIDRQQKDGAVNGYLVTKGLDKLEYGYEVVVGNKIFNAIQEDYAALSVEEFFEGKAQFLKIFGPYRVVLGNVG